MLLSYDTIHRLIQPLLDHGTITDYNGNTVGSWEITE